jgi:hypothetical protein
MDNDNSTELKIAPDKPSIEDKFIVDYAIGEPLTVPDELVTENQFVKEIRITPVKTLNCGSVINDDNADISL